MIDRPDIHTLTGAYAVDALPDDEREEIEQHLGVCDACAQEVAELQATASRLGAASYRAPSPGLRERVLVEIDATRQQRPRVVTDEPLAASGAADSAPSDTGPGSTPAMMSPLIVTVAPAARG